MEKNREQVETLWKITLIGERLQIPKETEENRTKARKDWFQETLKYLQSTGTSLSLTI